MNHGNIHLINHQYDRAVSCYTEALTLLQTDFPTTTSGSPTVNLKLTQFRALSHRSQVYASTKQYSKALEDMAAASPLLLDLKHANSHADSATNDDNDDALLVGEITCFYERMGIAYYHLNEYVQAKGAFEMALNCCSKENNDCDSDDILSFKDWIEKCTLKSSATNASESTSIPSTSPSTTATTATITTKQPQQSSLQKSKPTRPKYQYYQSSTQMTIQILQKQVQPQHLNVQLTPTHLTISLQVNGVDFSLICGSLYEEIIVEKCKTKIKEEKVLIKLKKKLEGEWQELLKSDGVGVGAGAGGSGTVPSKKTQEGNGGGTTSEKDSNPSTSTTTTTTSTPTPIPTLNKSQNRPYASTKDWNKIEQTLTLEEQAEKPEGDEALNQLFQNIYGNANDDTKRAMIKSFQTSGGTVLSTNWNEVKEKNYEKERDQNVPDGMQWRNWEGDRVQDNKK